jgi:hypothetical protein
MFSFPSFLNTWITNLDFSKRKSIVLPLIFFISLDLKIYLSPWILGLYLIISSILFAIKLSYSVVLDYSNSLLEVLILLSFRNCHIYNLSISKTHVVRLYSTKQN